MSNKVKSLLYFACFAGSSLLYYQMEQNDKTENQITVSEIEASETEELAEVNTKELNRF